jgi:hypothetical protein
LGETGFGASRAIDQKTFARRQNLKRLLGPQHIVFLGGERAGLAIRCCKEAGYAGRMFAVHPKKVLAEGRGVVAADALIVEATA